MVTTEPVELAKATKVLAIDADGHLIEPEDMWDQYLDPLYRERRRAGTGTSSAGLFSQAMGGLAGGAMGKYEDALDPEKAKQLKRHPGSSDANERLKVFEEEGYYAAMLYPTRMLPWTKDSFLWTAMCRAYNRWAGDWCSADRARLHAAVAINLGDVREAITELTRCVREYGSKAVFVRPNAYNGLKWNHPAYDPFWGACQEMDVAIGIHPSPIDDMPGFNLYYDMLTSQTDPPGGGLEFFLRNPMSHICDFIFTLGYLLCGGVLDRFPDLRFGVLESNGGWLVGYLERLDHRIENFHFQVPWMQMKPSEYFKRNCYVSFDPDESMLEPTVGVLGSDRIVWGSDFPHPDAFYPGIVDMMKRTMSNLGPEEQANILGNNARRFYKLSL